MVNSTTGQTVRMSASPTLRFVTLFTEIVVTEIMQNPLAVGDGVGEWFEVWVSDNIDTTLVGGGNRGDINLYGLMIEDLGSDDDMVNMDFIVGPNEYIVFGVNDDTTVNGGVDVDYTYSGINLANGEDELVLKNENSVSLDEVIWDDGSTFPDPNGASMSLDLGSIDADDNDLGASWCEATSSYGDGDLGTPGATTMPVVNHKG